MAFRVPYLVPMLSRHGLKCAIVVFPSHTYFLARFSCFCIIVYQCFQTGERGLVMLFNALCLCVHVSLVFLLALFVSQ